ncbi:MAG: methyltransferase family protein [Spirochaetales bacterium]
MSERKHLPVYGVGPAYVIGITILTAAGFALSYSGCLESGRLPACRIPFLVIGSFFIILGLFLWIEAAVFSKLDDHIKKNELVTTGVYACVRNPIYTAFIFIFTGALLFMNNLWLLILPVVFWLSLTVLMKCTEEKWLLKTFGSVYEDYCRKVNRVIPWFPGKS